MPEIEIDDQTFQALQSKAEPFVDTPNSVIRRLLGLDVAVPAEQASAGSAEAKSGAARRRQASGKRRSSKRTRAPRGSLLPEDEYVVPILKVLVEQGGSAPARNVVDRVGEILGDDFKPMDRELNSSGAPRWQTRVQFTRLRLVERGSLEKNSPRGTWVISERGREELKERTS